MSVLFVIWHLFYNAHIRSNGKNQKHLFPKQRCPRVGPTKATLNAARSFVHQLSAFIDLPHQRTYLPLWLVVAEKEKWKQIIKKNASRCV